MFAVSLSRYERETIINFNEEEKTADVYTHSPALKQRLKMMAAKYPEDVQMIRKNGAGGITYRVAKRLIHISLPKSADWKASRSAKAKESDYASHFKVHKTSKH